MLPNTVVIGGKFGPHVLSVSEDSLKLAYIGPTEFTVTVANARSLDEVRLNKLRCYVSLSSVRQLYYNLIYPYISYGLASWGSACQTRLQTVRKERNKCICSIFFASQRENASIYYKLLELHNLDNIFCLTLIKVASLVYKLKYHPSNSPAALHKLIAPSRGVHNYNIRYASKKNLYRPVSRTNYGLSRFTSMASRVWEKSTLQFENFALFFFYSTI